MPEALVTVQLDPAAGFQQEAAINTFAFSSDVPFGAPERLDILNAVSQFYAGVPAGVGSTLGSFLSSMLDRAVGACTMKFYDITGHLGGSPVGSPVEVSTFTLPAASTTANMPNQIAAVLTLRGKDALLQPVEAANKARVRARNTGRLFLGPFNTSAQDAVGATHNRPSVNLIAVANAAAETLQDSLVDSDYAWGVWSRTHASINRIVRAEMDNSWDVLRSRKISPTARTAKTFTPEPGDLANVNEIVASDDPAPVLGA